MMLAMLLLALQPGGEAPDPLLACAPRQNMTAAGPPPPVFHAQRMEISPESRVLLSVHLCPGGGFRVERLRTGPGSEERAPLEWVPVSQCAAIGGWIEAATRLRLPSPMLREHQGGSGPRRGTWFTLDARTLTGPGWLGSVTLEILEPPDAPPNALSFWFREGERLFSQCRDQGHGGTGYLPFRRGHRQ